MHARLVQVASRRGRHRASPLMQRDAERDTAAGSRNVELVTSSSGKTEAEEGLVADTQRGVRSHHDQNYTQRLSLLPSTEKECVEIQAQPNTALCVRDTYGSAGAKDLEVLERAIGCLVAFVKGTLPVAGCGRRLRTRAACTIAGLLRVAEVSQVRRAWHGR